MKAALEDQRGAIMVIGLFMALFATGCLFYLVGLGEAIAHRERMQEAADAAAFSAAVLHARGMNVIALVNMTMAALLAALIVLKLVELAGLIGVAIATGLAFFTSGASLSAVPSLAQVSINARQAHDAAKPGVQTSLRALRLAARGVRVAMPWVAQARTAQSVVDHYAPPALAGFTIPGRVTLPTRDGSYEDLCRKAGEYIRDLIDVPFADIKMPGFSVGEITGGLIGANPGWFCEADGGERPGAWTEREIWHPILPKGQVCEQQGKRPNLDRAEHERACADAKREIPAADLAIHPLTGECVPSAASDCGPDGLYELRASRAQRDCAPRARDDAQLTAFTWQMRYFTRRYAWDEGEWRVAEAVVPGSERLTLLSTDRRMCGGPSGLSPEWNGTRRRENELVPICHNVAPPSVPPIGSERTKDVVHGEVLQVFRCLERKIERKEVEGEGGGLAASEEEGRQMAPQRIAMGAELGDEDFQVRAAVVGTDASAPVAHRLLSAFKSDEADLDGHHTAPFRAASTLGRVAVAQAEMYFDHPSADSGDLLWSMRWTARLRRFRAPEGQPEPAGSDDLADAALHDVGAVHSTFESACAALAPEDFPCGAIDLSLLSDLVAH